MIISKHCGQVGNTPAVYLGESRVILSQRLVILTSVYGFPQPCKTDADIVPQTHPWTCPFTFFPVHYSAVLSHVTVYLELWKALFNKV